MASLTFHLLTRPISKCCHTGVRASRCELGEGRHKHSVITVDENVEELGLSYLMGGDAKWGINSWFWLLAPRDEHMTPIRVLP